MPVSGKHSQPYRGQPRPQYPKPRRQIRNLLKEQFIENIYFYGVIITSIVVLVGGFTLYFKGLNKLYAIMGGFIFFILMILAMIAKDGFSSINKFRKGYDYDESFSDIKEDKPEESPSSDYNPSNN